MTDDRMALIELVEKAADIDLVREMLAFAADRMMDAEVETETAITEYKIERFAHLLRDRLFGDAPEFRQAYAWLVLNDVSVTKDEIRISGSKAALARAADQGMQPTASRVLSFVREWRANLGQSWALARISHQDVAHRGG